MKELDKMYDIIFEDERLQELFLNFHSKYWYNLQVEEKIAIIEEINTIVAKLYGYKKNKINATDTHFYGSHSSYKWEIAVSKESLKKDNGYEIIDTYFHELRHAFQIRAIEGKLTALERVDEDLVEKWNRNFIPGNYIDSQGSHYMYQYVERDAWTHGMLFARKIYMLNRRKIVAHDAEWDNYCNQHRATIVNLISENDKSLRLMEQKDEEIEKLFVENLNDINEYKMGKEYVETLLSDHKIEDLSFDQVAILMSRYSFPYLHITNKVKVIQRYYDLIKVDDADFKIKLSTLGSIMIGKYKLSSDSPITIVNSILSYNFEKIVDNICDDKDSNYFLSDTAKKEIKLNMYKNSKGKRINFIKDSENMFMFALQPYAKYETYYILKEFMRLKEAELAYFKKNHSDWSYWENYYDNKLIFDTASKLMGMKFSDYYKLQLAKYKRKILMDKKKSTQR